MTPKAFQIFFPILCAKPNQIHASEDGPHLAIKCTDIAVHETPDSYTGGIHV